MRAGIMKGISPDTGQGSLPWQKHPSSTRTRPQGVKHWVLRLETSREILKMPEKLLANVQRSYSVRRTHNRPWYAYEYSQPERTKSSKYRLLDANIEMTVCPRLLHPLCRVVGRSSGLRDLHKVQSEGRFASHVSGGSQ